MEANWWELLKKGDKVRCIANNRNMDRTIGRIYTVKKDYYNKNASNGIYYYLDCCSTAHEEWELVEPVSFDNYEIY